VYRGRVKRALGGIKEGERIVVEKGGRIFEGTLMPRTELGDDKHLVLKLDNGYNIGIAIKGARIRRAAR
jgi:glutamyl-tRNA(Gln) amidotransferase subunit D